MFIRYNETLQYWEYDTSAGQTGAGPWIKLPIKATQITGIFDSPLTIAAPTIAELDLIETGANFLLRVINYQSRFQVFYNPVGALLAVDAIGNILVKKDIYEKDRSIPLGHWIDTPFNSADYIATGGMTWTVVSAGTVNKYTVIGRTLVWSIVIGPSTLGGTISNNLYINLPAGFASTQTQTLGMMLVQGSPKWEIAILKFNGTQVNITREGTANYVAGSNNYFTFQVCLPI